MGWGKKDPRNHPATTCKKQVTRVSGHRPSRQRVGDGYSAGVRLARHSTSTVVRLATLHISLFTSAGAVVGVLAYLGLVACVLLLGCGQMSFLIADK